MAKRNLCYSPKRGWYRTEMMSFLHPSTEAGAAEALRAAQKHYGEKRVIEVVADGHPRKGRDADTTMTFYKPRLRAANAV